MKVKLFHISKTIKMLLICLIIFSCSDLESTSSDLKEGKYAWKKQSKLEQGINQFVFNTGVTIGDTLILIDSLHFKQITCGNYGYGQYVVNGDSLLLNFDSTATRRDSLWDYSKYTEIYYIEDERTLTQELKIKYSKDSKETHKVISRLHYVENSDIKE